MHIDTLDLPVSITNFFTKLPVMPFCHGAAEYIPVLYCSPLVSLSRMSSKILFKFKMHPYKTCGNYYTS